MKGLVLPNGYWVMVSETGKPAISEDGYLIVATPPANVQYHKPGPELKKMSEGIGKGAAELWLFEYRP